MLVPSTWSVEIKNGHMPLTIHTLATEGNWTIRSGGEVDLVLNEQGSILVQAQTYNESNLRGNVQWTIDSQITGKPESGGVRGFNKKGDANVQLFIESHSIRLTES